MSNLFSRKNIVNLLAQAAEVVKVKTQDDTCKLELTRKLWSEADGIFVAFYCLIISLLILKQDTSVKQ